LYADNEKDVPYDEKWNWPPIALFCFKTLFVAIAYAYLLTFICFQLMATASLLPPVR